MHLREVRSPAELDSLFTAMVRERVPSSCTRAKSSGLTAHASPHSRPRAACRRWASRRWGEAGGLLAYSASDLDRFQRAAYYVDKLLRGTQAADLPVEQPMKFKFWSSTCRPPRPSASRSPRRSFVDEVIRMKTTALLALLVLGIPVICFVNPVPVGLSHITL